MKNLLSPRIILIVSLILLGALTRLIPHPFNFTGIAAIALFAGAKFSNRYLAFLIPFAAMLFTDMIIGFHAATDMIAVYACFAMVVVVGMLIKSNQKAIPVIMASLITSILFYLVTNFSVWPGNLLYSQDLSGLLQSYIAGIPFFRNQVLGDLFYSGILFGGYYLAEQKFGKSLLPEAVKVRK